MMMTKILMLLLLSAPVPGRTQESSEVRKDQEKKALETTRGTAPSQQREQPAASRQPSRETAPRTPDETARQRADVPSREPSPQEDLRRSQTGDVQTEEVRKVFYSVEDGLSDASIGRFSPHFGSQVSLALRGGESGTYSANQAYYVLENYIRTHKLVEFSFETVSESGANPYAKGNVGFAAKGGRESAQVYVALVRAGERWVITQINIY